MAAQSVTSPARVAVFRCDATLRIARIDGDIAARLGCESGELQEHLWHPFLHKEDWPIIEQMGMALAEARSGQYRLRAVARNLEQLDLSINTFVTVEPVPTVGGSISLVQWASPRCYIDLGSK